MPVFTDRGEELYPITLDMFEAMADAGLFGEEDRVPAELLDGAIVAMTPEGDEHVLLAFAITRWAFAGADADRTFIGVSNPLRLPPLSRPMPDLWLAEHDGSPLTRVPTDSRLVIEISVTSLRRDLGRKAAIYARAGVPEYWVIDVERHAVHVHRDPREDVYASITLVEPPALLSPASIDLPPLDLGELLGEG